MCGPTLKNVGHSRVIDQKRKGYRQTDLHVQTDRPTDIYRQTDLHVQTDRQTDLHVQSNMPSLLRKVLKFALNNEYSTNNDNKSFNDI